MARLRTSQTGTGWGVGAAVVSGILGGAAMTHIADPAEGLAAGAGIGLAIGLVCWTIRKVLGRSRR